MELMDHPEFFPIYELFSGDFWLSPDARWTDRQTESNAYEPIVQFAQVGSNIPC